MDANIQGTKELMKIEINNLEIRKKIYKVVKRIADIIGGIIGLILLSPVFLILAICIKIDSKGPVIFAHKRIGKNGKEFNIINGDLSIIGPRPIVDEELKKYGDNKEKFLSITPGLTGYWQANGRSNTSYEERMQMELYYIDNQSLLLDIKIFFKTIVSVIKKEGAM